MIYLSLLSYTGYSILLFFQILLATFADVPSVGPPAPLPTNTCSTEHHIPSKQIRGKTFLQGGGLRTLYNPSLDPPLYCPSNGPIILTGQSQLVLCPGKDLVWLLQHCWQEGQYHPVLQCLSSRLLSCSHPNTEVEWKEPVVRTTTGNYQLSNVVEVTMFFW